MAEPAGGTSGPEDDELADWLDGMAITDDQRSAVQERLQRENEERKRRIFGDTDPFPIPDTDTDA